MMPILTQYLMRPNLSFLRTQKFIKQSQRCFKTKPKKVNSSGNAAVEELAIKSEPLSPKLLSKPLLFTLLFSSTSIAGMSIWQYENLRLNAIVFRKSTSWFQQPVKKTGKWRQNINNWWNSLSEEQKVFISISFSNLIVYGAWKIPKFRPFMVKYFCSSPFAKAVCWPMILSTFSHYSSLHLIGNMFVLYTFSSGVITNMGKEQYLGLYFSSGVISNFSSYLCKIIIRQHGSSLGASGAVMGIFGYVCSKYSDNQLSIIFFPTFTFSALSGLKFLMSFDLAGIIFKWKFFDHAAHLGGALWGIYWCYWGDKYIWQNRDKFLQYWHRLREGSR